MKRKLTSAFIVILILTIFCQSAMAIVEPTDDFYVNDNANVLSESTEEKILELNDNLYHETGAEIVVVTVDFLDGQDIENYAYQLFNNWGIGHTDTGNYGVLLLLAIGEENYWCTVGQGLDSVLTASELDDLLYNYLEDDFASGDYDAGVLSVTNQISEVLYDELETGKDYGRDDATDEAADHIGNTIITVAIVLGVIILVVGMPLLRGRRRHGAGYFFFRPRYYPPHNRPFWDDDINHRGPGGPGGFGGPGGPGGFGGGGFPHGGGGGSYHSPHSGGGTHSSGGSFHAPRSGGGGFSRGGGAGRRGH